MLTFILMLYPFIIYCCCCYYRAPVVRWYDRIPTAAGRQSNACDTPSSSTVVVVPFSIFILFESRVCVVDWIYSEAFLTSV